MKVYKFFFILIFMLVSNSNAERYIVYLNDSNVVKSSFDNKIINLKNIHSQSLINLNSNDRASNIKVIKSLWSINAVVVEASKDILLELDNIKYFIADRKENSINVNKSFFKFQNSDVSWNISNMNIPEIWSDYGFKGKDIVVGIIDTGLDINHIEFSDLSKIKNAWSFGKVINPSELIDNKGHGSHVAGIIGGSDKSGQSIGVAPLCDFVIARAVGVESVRASDLLEAMQYMLDRDENPYTDDYPRIINCSWHSSYDYQNPYYEMIETWLDFNIIPCFSAGNWGPEEKTITNPKEHPGTFATGAVDSSGIIAKFSSRGPGVFNGEFTQKPDWTAPGVDIISVESNGDYVQMSGTSMASPHIAGLCALILESGKQLSVEDIRYILRKSCSNSNSNEYSKDYGYGFVNGKRALDIVMNGSVLKGKVDNNIVCDIKILENGRIIQTDENGVFSVFLLQGDYNIEVMSYGYKTLVKSISISENSVENISFKLEKINTLNFKGIVLDSLSNNYVKSVINIENSNFSETFETDKNGKFSFELSSGIYNILINSDGYRTLSLRDFPVYSDINEDFVLQKASDVLIIDNDSGKKFDKCYSEYFEKENISFEYIELEDNEIFNIEKMSGYNLVIWVMGNNIGTRLIKDNRDMLRDYTKNGGNLFISGQDIAVGLRRGYEESDFLENTLKASYSKDRPSQNIICGENIEFTLEKMSNTGYDQVSPDVINPKNGSNAIFTYKDNSGAAGIYYLEDYKLLYLSFSPARIKDENIRQNILKKCFELFEFQN
ncbi:MAG: S8 family serine peptidase [Candidatus Muirbacterium halophilum]|nr:S8 family serine peptidase [Candidatus Muirbacterium halophilum]